MVKQRRLSNHPPAWPSRWALGLFICLGLGAAGPLQAEQQHEPLENIIRSARTFLHRATADQGGETRISVDATDSRLRLRRCEQDLSVELAPGAKLIGNTTVNVRCSAPVPWSIFVTGRVERYDGVVMVAQPISRQQIIQPSHVRLEHRQTADLFSGYYNDLSQVVGMQARRALTPGQVVIDAHIAPPLMVERGQLVTLISTSGRLTVSAQGEALENGHQGARIRVRNRASRRELEGIVEAPGIVRIPL